MTQAKSKLPAALADQYGTFECAISAIMLIKNPRYKRSPINPRSIKTRKTVECGCLPGYNNFFEDEGNFPMNSSGR